MRPSNPRQLEEDIGPLSVSPGKTPLTLLVQERHDLMNKTSVAHIGR